MLCTASACLPHGHRVFPVLSPAVCGALGLFDLPAAFDSVDPTLLLETLHLLDSRTPLSLTSKIEVPWALAIALFSSVFICTLGLLVISSGLQGSKPFLG